MAVISVNLTDTFEQWRTKTNSIGTKQGDLTTLTTTAKGTVVAAINELDAAASFANVVEDTTPQLGGDLDLNGNIIDFKPEEPVSNINSVGANTTTTLASTRNYMLAGPTITVDSSYTWTIGGTGALQII
mgnify:CR=1 FL=1